MIDAAFQEMASAEIAKHVDQQVINEVTWIRYMHTHSNWHLVEIPWEKTHDKNFSWNEACAWAVEQFGLPGGNYVTHPSVDQMKFLFKHEEHAILMTLKWI